MWCVISRRRRLALAVVLLVGLGAVPVAGHSFAPALLELRQDGGELIVRFKQPQVRVAGSRLKPVLPPSCEPAGEPTTRAEGTAIVTTWRVVCGALAGETLAGETLAGETLAVEGIAGSRADVLLRLELAGGRVVHHVLTADRPSFVVPAAPDRLGVAALYTRLGFEHILAGADHLLFVLGLVLLVDGRRRLLATVTAFTVGHSITLALASLGFVHLPQAPTEVAIAFSLYVLAVELGRGTSGGLLRRSPWTMAVLFGLLHGLGFAGALSEVGLPAGEIPAALLTFNVGIELGQLAFVVVVLAGRRLVGHVSTLSWGRKRNRAAAWLAGAAAAVPAYVIGSLAVFWCIERLGGLF